MKKILNALKQNKDLTILISGIIIVVVICGCYLVNCYNTNKAYTEALNDLNNIETSIEFDSTSYFFFGSYDKFVSATKNIKPNKTIDNNNYYVVYDTSSEQKIIIK